MNLRLTLAAAVVASACLPAQASLIDAKFAGVVTSQSGTAFAVAAPITGEFLYDTSTASYRFFYIDGQSVAPGYSSSADFTPDRYSALYQAQLSPVPGGLLNSTFTLDLEALNTPWADATPLALLSDAAALAGNLDKTLSNFGFYTANANGTNIRQLSASLNSLVVTVPEPGSLALVALGGALFALRPKRRG